MWHVNVIVYINTPIYVTCIKTEDVSGTTAMIEHLEISQGGWIHIGWSWNATSWCGGVRVSLHDLCVKNVVNSRWSVFWKMKLLCCNATGPASDHLSSLTDKKTVKKNKKKQGKSDHCCVLYWGTNRAKVKLGATQNKVRCVPSVVFTHAE